MKEIPEIYKDIYPTLNTIEKQRIKVLSQRRNIFFIVLTLIILMAIYGFILSLELGEFPSTLLLLMGLTAAGGIGIYIHKVNKVTRAFKFEVITKIIESIDESYDYHPGKYINERRFNASKLFQRPDRYSGEDFIAGRLDKTDFEMSEIHAEYKSKDVDGDTTYYTIFKGLLMIADFHKDFHGHTVVVPDETGEGWFGRIAKGSKRKGLELAKMENPYFEKAFDVYTTDQIEARYILSMSMLENIMRLKEQFDSQVHIAFLDSCIYIAIEWDEKFLEPSLNESLLNESKIHQYLDDILFCLEIIEELNLNTRIWSKA